jgi:putative nucleotidyltransferase with HDIG domain
VLERRKMLVGELDLGMYVAELDRPWEGTPFLFQGFRIETQAELDRLRGLCQFVFVDETRAIEVDQPDRTIARSMSVKSGGAAERPAVAEWAARGPKVVQGKVRGAIQQSFKLRANASTYVTKVFEDVRLGTSINTAEAKQVVSAMVDVVAESADSLVWLTQLKNAHEYTLQHSVNVCILSLAFAHHLGYPKEQMQQIGLGALLHDIGKIRTPIDVLDKPGKLTDHEFEIMRRHPVDGWKMLRDKPEMSEASLEIVKYHHERLSGRGYPEGRKADQLSTHVLLVAICDVYDAMTSDRIYQRGVPSTVGLTAMHQLAPSEFGKELMQEFIRCLGIYPVGSLVELTDRSLGIVMVNDPSNRLRPVVLLVRDGDGDNIFPRRYAALSVEGDAKGAAGSKPRRVQRVVDPREYGMNLQAIIASEVLEANNTQVFHV